jgi:hypothetical protein
MLASLCVHAHETMQCTRAADPLLKTHHSCTGRARRRELLHRLNNLLSVHLIHQILWEDKERELAAPAAQKKGPISKKSDLEITEELVNA